VDSQQLTVQQVQPLQQVQGVQQVQAVQQAPTVQQIQAVQQVQAAQQVQAVQQLQTIQPVQSCTIDAAKPLLQQVPVQQLQPQRPIQPQVVQPARTQTESKMSGRTFTHPAISALVTSLMNSAQQFQQQAAGKRLNTYACSNMRQLGCHEDEGGNIISEKLL